MPSSKFVDKNASLDTYWRSIILLGNNTASYKFALAKSLLNVSTKENKILLEDFALPYARNICDHLKLQEKQTTSASSKFLDSCKRFNQGEITEDELRGKTLSLALFCRFCCWLVKFSALD